MIKLFTLCFLLSGNLFSIDFSHIKENDEDKFKLQREEYFRQMHQCDPEIDYKIIDFETRYSKFLNRNSQSSDKLKTNQLQADSKHKSWIDGTWKEIGSNNLAGRIRVADIDFNSQLIYAGSDGGNLWRGSIDGTNWTCLNNYFKYHEFRAVYALPAGNSRRIICATNSPAKIWYSDDEWQTVKFASGLDTLTNVGGSIKRCLISGTNNDFIYVLASMWDSKSNANIHIVYSSNDLGNSFKKVYQYKESSDCSDIWTSRYYLGDLYLNHADSIITINNTTVKNQIKSDYKYSQGTNLLLNGFYNNKTSSTNLYLLVRSGSKSTLWASDNLGSNWTNVSSVSTDLFDRNSFAVSATNGDYIYCGNQEFYYTTNFGISWQKKNTWPEYYQNMQSKLHADIPGIFCLKSPAGVDFTLIGTDGGLYISNDLCTNVKNVSLKGLNVGQYYSTYSLPHNPDYVLSGSQDQGFQAYQSISDDKFSFTQVISGDYGHLSSADSGKHLWLVYPGITFLAEEPNSQRLSRMDFQGQNRLWISPICADISNPSQAYLSNGGQTGTAQEANSSFLWRMSYDGNSITGSPLPYDFQEGKSGRLVSAVAVSPINPTTVYSLNNAGHFYISTDRANSWTKCDSSTGLSPHYFYGSCICPSKVSSGKVFICGSGYNGKGVFVTDDYGKIFKSITSGLPSTMIYRIAASDDDEFVFAATEVGPYVYVAKKNQWYDISDGSAPDQIYWWVEYISKTKTARFSTYGRGIWDYRITKYITEVTQNEEFRDNEIQIKAEPNPFQNELNFKIDLPAQTLIRVCIYDLEGRIIKKFAENFNISKVLSLKWDGISDNGTEAPKGIYLLTVSANGISNYSKIIKL
ncbi:MAG: T9SS type A sorting domain-containing protein [Candidatus Kapabacteria bacterium]|nr:T9SS type A sorting domain-containing protein [Candidatus Kapabacteria bacterium]